MVEDLSTAALTQNGVGRYIDLAASFCERNHCTRFKARQIVLMYVDFADVSNILKGICSQGSHIVVGEGKRANVCQVLKGSVADVLDTAGSDAQFLDVAESRECPGLDGSDVRLMDENLGHILHTSEGVGFNAFHLTVHNQKLIQPHHSRKRSVDNGFHLGGLNFQERQVGVAFEKRRWKASDCPSDKN